METLLPELDMSGNGWEWLADWYDAAYYQNSPQENPQGPASGDRRVRRGGSWSDSDFLRSAHRGRDLPYDSYSTIGFRCASTEP